MYIESLQKNLGNSFLGMFLVLIRFLLTRLRSFLSFHSSYIWSYVQVIGFMILEWSGYQFLSFPHCLHPVYHLMIHSSASTSCSSIHLRISTPTPKQNISWYQYYLYLKQFFQEFQNNSYFLIFNFEKIIAMLLNRAYTCVTEM